MGGFPKFIKSYKNDADSSAAPLVSHGAQIISQCVKNATRARDYSTVHAAAEHIDREQLLRLACSPVAR